MHAVGDRTVVLSPHLDDAALAVGGYLARRASEGATTHVVTVYTAGPDLETLPNRLRVFADYRTRLIEDDAALAKLNASSERLGLCERIFRHPPLGRVSQVFRTPPVTAELGEFDRLVRAVCDLLADPEVELLAPLGVGNHVDHVEVSVATMTAAVLCDAHHRVWFYEDFYALSTLARRRHPVTRGSGRRWVDAPSWASPRAGLRLEAASVVASGPSSVALFGGPVSWSPRVVDIAGYEDRKLDAIDEYRTQTAALGGADALRSMLRRGHRRTGGETMWRMHRLG